MGIVEDIDAQIASASTKIEAATAAVVLVQGGIDLLQAEVLALKDQVAQGSPASTEQLTALLNKVSALASGSTRVADALDAAAADIAAG